VENVSNTTSATNKMTTNVPVELPVGNEPVDYRTQEIAIELRNVYHSYDNKFSNLLLRNRSERHMPNTSTSNPASASVVPRVSSETATSDRNNNPFFSNVSTSSPFQPFDSIARQTSIGNRSAVPSVADQRSSANSNGSSVRFQNFPPKLHLETSFGTNIDPAQSTVPPTPGVQATPNLELPSGIRYSSKLILSNLNVTIPRGCIYGLLGPSGCGKTTLLKCITGFQKPTYGRVRVFGCIPWSGVGSVPGPDLGYMPQDYSLHEDLTIAEMLTYFGRIFELPADVIRRRIPELVELLSLPSQNQLIGNLSGGQKRRASFICSIIHMPQ
jgi:ABC-type glutathione transport system ATPase component